MPIHGLKNLGRLSIFNDDEDDEDFEYLYKNTNELYTIFEITSSQNEWGEEEDSRLETTRNKKQQHIGKKTEDNWWMELNEKIHGTDWSSSSVLLKFCIKAIV